MHRCTPRNVIIALFALLAAFLTGAWSSAQTVVAQPQAAIHGSTVPDRLSGDIVNYLHYLSKSHSLRLLDDPTYRALFVSAFNAKPGSYENLVALEALKRFNKQEGVELYVSTAVIEQHLEATKASAEVIQSLTRPISSAQFRRTLQDILSGNM